ncbi:MAG: superoxide dismutase [Bdellovibrionales bacterium CG10_big_fil_rev_8_21_14_0_10_45_34]|nr:MAG: superoxide dismutase [Bdellovibrionales bacterium CG10_big_fil_rev_8_21_14_0_10_45_34]
MKIINCIYTISLGLGALSFVACSSKQTATEESQRKLAQLEAKSGSKVTGEIHLVQVGETVRLTGEVKGLKPNSVHGFHIHEFGDCSTKDAASAGGHFNPDGHKHGGPKEVTRHAGDLGNITADKDGIALVEVSTQAFTLEPNSKVSVLGKSIIVHEKHDEFDKQPAGNAGARIACGIIR